MNQDSANADVVTKRVSLKNLYLDPNNYRLIHEKDQIKVDEDHIKDQAVARRTFRLLVGDKNQHIRDLIDSFKSNGYLPVDQIQVRELASGGHVVVEGNRRIATLKFLAQEYDQKGIELGRLDPAIFSRVPVVLYNDADESHHLTLMALKHISGNKKWGEWNQAKLLEKMHRDYGTGEDEICRKVGISKVALRRSLRALALVKQYQDSDYGDQFNESKFPIFRETVSNSALKQWLGWDEGVNKPATHIENTELFFSLLSQEPDEEEDDDGHIGFNSSFKDPAITKRDDIRLLSKILKDEQALKELKYSRDLHSAFSASDLVFTERRERAVQSVAKDIKTLKELTIHSEQLPELESALGHLQGIVDRTRGSGLSGVEQNRVFHDRIDQHFSSLHIESYKKLKNLRLNKLSRINLLAGLNNSGKTTLLEAIYLLVKQNDFAGILEVIRRRGKIPEDHINPAWLVEQLEGKIAVSGMFDHKESSLQIRDYMESGNDLDTSRYLRTLEIITRFGAEGQESQTRVFKGRERETLSDSIRLLSQVVYSSPFFLNEPQHYTTFYHKSVQSKALPIILEFISEEISPSISDVRLVDELQRFLVSDNNFDKALDLMGYGEGLQRIFFISLIFASAQNGVVLIDEFENAIHAELIGKFAPFIHKLAVTFNVQVFLTTHSKECVDAFVANVPEVDDFSYSTLVNEGEQIAVREYTGKKFKKLVEAGDIDLRSIR